MANSQYPKTITFTQTIPFDQPLSYIPEYTVSSSLTFTKDTTNAYPGYGTMVRLVADGTHTPDLSDFALEGPGAWDNTNGAVNKLFFYYDGEQYCVIITQPGTGGTGGGGGGATALNAPTGLTPDGASIDSTSAVINFTDTNSSPNESNVAFYINTVNNSGTATLKTTVAANSTIVTLTGLTAGTTYYVWAKAKGNGTTTSDSPFSTVATFDTAVDNSIDWAQENGATDEGGGTLSASIANKGATGTRKLAKADGNYVEMTIPTPSSDGAGAVLGLVTVDDADYTWSTKSWKGAMYVISGHLYGGSGASPGGDYGAIADGDVVRLEISGNNLLLKKNGSTLATLTGVLSGVTDIWVVGIFALNGAAKIYQAQGNGLI